MYKFPKIQNFHNMIKTGLRGETSVMYQGKIKLHGTNAGIHISRPGALGSRVIQAQSRNRNIDIGDDNVGFAAWVDEHAAFWNSIGSEQADLTIYGEWCGRGINQGAAINTIPEKCFAIFAIMIGTDISEESEALMLSDPEHIFDYLSGAANPQPNKIDIPSNVYVLPYYGDPFMVHFNDHISLTEAVDQINKTVEAVDKRDPWVEEIFGIVGPGEGVVYAPTTGEGICYRNEYSRLAFKAKGDTHSDVKQKRPVLPDPEVQANVKEFVDKFVTETRLEHMVTEHNLGEFNMCNMGTFLKVISQDVHDESKAEIEASPIEWKQAAKGVVNAARTWYIGKSKEL